MLLDSLVPPSSSSSSNSDSTLFSDLLLGIQPSNTNDNTNRDSFYKSSPSSSSYRAVPSPDDGIPGEDDEDATWLLVLVIVSALFITIVSLIRNAKPGWLAAVLGQGQGSSGSNQGTTTIHGANGSHLQNGQLSQANGQDDDIDNPSTRETEARLAALTDAQRQSYDLAKVFQTANPPGSVPTDISLSQYLSIQEKGVSAWEFEASYDHRLFVHDRTELSFFEREASVQTNLPLPKQQEVYYWEVKVFEKSPETIVAVGVSTKPYPTWRLPGWNRHSVGYFSKDGHKYYNAPWNGRPCGPCYFEGDVIGCGYRPRTGSIFFTRNGKRVEEAYHGLRYNLFPTVGATGRCVLHVNFGQSGFVFVEANVKKWGLAPASGSLAPPPAYGSERGSILLEAGNTSRPTTVTRPTLQSSLSRNRIQAAGILIQMDDDLHPDADPTGRRAIINGNGSSSRTDSRNTNNSGNQADSHTHISLSNMSAPPPNYASVEQHQQQQQQLQTQQQTISRTSSSSLTSRSSGALATAGGSSVAAISVAPTNLQRNGGGISASRSSSDSERSVTLLLSEAAPQES